MVADHPSYVGSEVLASLEIGMAEDGFRAAPEAISGEYGYGGRRLGDALLAHCSGIPENPQLNRLVGLKSSQPNWRQHLREAIAEFDQRGTAGVVEAMAADLLLLDELHELGFRPTPQGTFTLVRSSRPERSDEAALPIHELTAQHGAQFVGLVATVFHMPTKFVEHYAGFIGRPGWTIFGAFDGATLVATGGLYFEQHHAYVCFGATLSDYRGRGLQKSLISTRIEAARSRKATFLSASVASPTSGASNPSFRNLHQAGFRVASERTLFSRPSHS